MISKILMVKIKTSKATSLKTGEVFIFLLAEAERKGYGNQRHISSVCLEKKNNVTGINGNLFSTAYIVRYMYLKHKLL